MSTLYKDMTPAQQVKFDLMCSKLQEMGVAHTRLKELAILTKYIATDEQIAEIIRLNQELENLSKEIKSIQIGGAQ